MFTGFSNSVFYATVLERDPISRTRDIVASSFELERRRSSPKVVLLHQLRWVYPDFPVRAADRLIEDLMLDPDDIDMDVFVDVTKRTGRSRRETKANPFYGRIKTAGDLVAFFCAQERRSS
jgi:hypothetical protein